MLLLHWTTINTFDTLILTQMHMVEENKIDKTLQTPPFTISFCDLLDSIACEHSRRCRCHGVAVLGWREDWGGNGMVEDTKDCLRGAGRGDGRDERFLGSCVSTYVVAFGMVVFGMHNFPQTSIAL
jgi:hypothetical protein